MVVYIRLKTDGINYGAGNLNEIYLDRRMIEYTIQYPVQLFVRAKCIGVL